MTDSDVVVNFLLGCAFIACVVALLMIGSGPPVTQAEYMDATNGKARGDIGRMLGPPREANDEGVLLFIEPTDYERKHGE